MRTRGGRPEVRRRQAVGRGRCRCGSSTRSIKTGAGEVSRDPGAGPTLGRSTPGIRFAPRQPSRRVGPDRRCWVVELDMRCSPFVHRSDGSRSPGFARHAAHAQPTNPGPSGRADARGVELRRVRVSPHRPAPRCPARSSSPSGCTTRSASGSEFVEVTNIGGEPVDMTSYSFDDDSRAPGTFSLAGLGTLAAGESGLIVEAHGRGVPHRVGPRRARQDRRGQHQQPRPRRRDQHLQRRHARRPAHLRRRDRSPARSAPRAVSGVPDHVPRARREQRRPVGALGGR